MKVFKFGGIAFGFAATVVLLFLMPILFETQLLGSAPLALATALIALSVSGSGVIALLEPLIRQD